MKKLLVGAVFSLAVSFSLGTATTAEAQVVIRIAPPAPRIEVVPAAPTPQHTWANGHWTWNPRFRRHVWLPGRYLMRQPNRVWVQAQWVDRGGQWAYQPGRWEMAGRTVVVTPPQPQPVYVQQPQPQPVYVQQPQPQPVYVQQPQPQPVYVQPQPQPQPVYVQQQPQQVYYEEQVPQAGYYEADAAPPPPQVEVVTVAPSPQHTWIGGYWSWKPGRRHVWMPGRWEVRRVGRAWDQPRWQQGPGGRWRYHPGRWR